MDRNADRIITTTSERTSESFSITVESEVVKIDYRAFRTMAMSRSAELMRDPMDDAPQPSSEKFSPVPRETKTQNSRLDLVITSGRLTLSRTTDGGAKINLNFADLISCADQFFTDDTVNAELENFLSENFPNDFERTKTFNKLLEAWENRSTSIAIEDLFGDGGVKKIEDYAAILLMVLGYGFPALYHRIPYDLTSDDLFVIALDMKLSYGDFMTASTESELADMAFGNRRKTFRRVTPLLSLCELSLVNQLSTIVSVDVLDWAFSNIDFTLDRRPVDCWYGEAEVLANFSPTVQRHIVKDLFISGARDVEDALYMVKRYVTKYSDFKGTKTIEQMHDKACDTIPEITDDSRIENVDYSIRDNREIFIPEISSKLELLVSHKEFIRIGRELKICIGAASYFEKSISGDSYCYKILKDGALIGALEVSRNAKGDWVCVQCRGFRNKDLDIESVIVETILGRLEEIPAAFSFAAVS